MKKIIAIVSIATCMCTTFTGCVKFQDNNPAVLEVKANRNSAVVQSYNGTNSSISGAERSMRNPVMFTLKEGEKANLHFFCESCGCDEMIEIEAPFAKMFVCECPIEMNANGNAREYISVAVQKKEE